MKNLSFAFGIVTFLGFALSAHSTDSYPNYSHSKYSKDNISAE